MRDFVFNDACVPNAFSSHAQACQSLLAIASGMIALKSSELARNVLRLTQYPYEIYIADGLSLQDAMFRIRKENNTREVGQFLLNLSQKAPIEEDLDEESQERIMNWNLKEFPGSLGLLLCASSDHFAVSATEDANWHDNFINVTILKPGGAEGQDEKDRRVKNIHSADVEDLKRAIVASENKIKGKTATELWNERKKLFPNLRFAPSVENNLRALESNTTGFKVAASKLLRLDESASEWNGEPNYILEQHGESKATMNQYGKEREFRGEDGKNHIYKLHVRLVDGFRMHFREMADSKQIEIGYIGPHLKVSKLN